jgi:hypothetical protein
MPRSVYGTNYKPRSKIPRNLVLAATIAIVVAAFVWMTHDPKTFRRLSGFRPEVTIMQPAVEALRVDAKEKRVAR